jgi:hypothetical protein
MDLDKEAMGTLSPPFCLPEFQHSTARGRGGTE